jgi:hypothetical protein
VIPVHAIVSQSWIDVTLIIQGPFSGEGRNVLAFHGRMFTRKAEAVQDFSVLPRL